MSQWQLELKNAVKDYKQLFELIHIKVEQINKKFHSTLNYNIPILVTRSFINRIAINDPNDPLLLQILPNPNNATLAKTGYSEDPLEELNFNKIPGLIHKYYGRVLILATQGCAINCQYCFRKYFPYKNNLLNSKNLAAIIKYINQDYSIEEIILSGGDPLLLSNNAIAILLAQLSTIKHINTIRIHSRIPIVLPSRIEPQLIEILQNSRFNIVLVTHSNHPNEINQEVITHIKQLHNTKITLLNQSVLLHQVNDDPIILAKLSKKLFQNKILPYYLHTLDPIVGSEHFAVPLTKIQQIFTNLTEILPGYLVPKLVTEIPGAKAKTLININNIKLEQLSK